MYSVDCSFVDEHSSCPDVADGAPPRANVMGEGSFGARNIDESPGIAGSFHPSASIDERLTQLAAMTAGSFNAEICFLLLLESGAPPEIRFKLYSGSGTLPMARYTQWVGRAEVLARKAITADRVCDGDDSSGPRPGTIGEVDDPQESMIASPIRIDGSTIGVVIVACEDPRLFNAENRGALDTVSWLVGQSLKTVQLESLLNSRFAQMAVAQEAKHTLVNALAVSHRPDQLSKILAKSFYREMVKVGLSSGQIINAASEIISQLSNNLQKHKSRSRRADKKRESSREIL